MSDPFDKMADTASGTPTVNGLTADEHMSLSKLLDDEKNDGMRALFLLMKGRFEQIADRIVPLHELLEDTAATFHDLLTRED